MLKFSAIAFAALLAVCSFSFGTEPVADSSLSDAQIAHHWGGGRRGGRHSGWRGGRGRHYNGGYYQESGYYHDGGQYRGNCYYYEE